MPNRQHLEEISALPCSIIDTVAVIKKALNNDQDNIKEFINHYDDVLTCLENRATKISKISDILRGGEK